MMNKTTKALTEAALTSALTCIFGIIAIYVPLMSIFMFFVTIPLVIVSRRQGVKYAVMSLIVSSVVIMMMSSVLTALYIVLLPGIPAIVIGLGMYYAKPVPFILTSGFVAAMLISVLTLWLTQQISGIMIQDSIRTMMETSIQMSEALFSQLPLSDEESIQSSRQMMQKYMETAILVIPAVIIVFSCASSLLNYLIAGKILKRVGSPVEPLAPFKEFRLPRNVTTGILIILLLTLLASKLAIIDPELITANVILLMQVTFSIQGLAVMLYCMDVYRFAKVLRVVLVLLVLFSSFGMMVLMMTGMLDIILDFRKRVELRRQK